MNKRRLIIQVALLFLTCTMAYTQNWYDQAEERIDTLRKGDFSFKVVDPGSNPIHDSVSIKLKKHEFQWGNILTHHAYDQNDFDWYQATMLKYFNAGNIERFKWNYMEPEPGNVNYSEIDTIMGWAKKAGWYTRGHCLIWGGPNSWQLPSWIVADTMSGEKMYEACETRIRRDVTKYAGAINEYDVINEPFHETWLAERTGDSINWNAFKWAEESDPAAKLFVNEFNIIVWPVIDDYMATIRELLSNGAPLDGIGVQGHMENNINWQQIKTSLDSLAKFNLPITVTEFDMKIDEYSISEQNQADYYARIMRTMFSYPLVEGFYFFGVYDKYAWREGSGIFNENKFPKIAADTVYQLIHEKWSTSVTDTTDSEGICKFNGFYGDYEVTVKTGDSTAIFDVPFTKANEGIEIELNLVDAMYPHPELLQVQTNTDGSQVELVFDMEMNDPSSNIDKFSVYSVTEIPITSVSLKTGNPNSIVLTLSAPLIYRQKAYASYTFGDLTSVKGGTLSNFGPEEIVNMLPGFKAGYTNEEGTQVIVTFSKEMSDVIPIESFGIEVNNEDRTITGAEIVAGDAETIAFSLGTPVEDASDMIFISYNPGTFASWDGYLLGAFGPKYVQNNVPPDVESLNTSNSDKDILIYPNPAENYIVIESAKAAGHEFRYKIVDISGKLCLSGTADFGKQLDISQIDQGIYFVKINTDDKLTVRKFILE